MRHDRACGFIHLKAKWRRLCQEPATIAIPAVTALPIFVASARLVDANDCLLHSKVERVDLFLQFYRLPDGASASLGADGKLHLTVSNANPQEDMAVTVFVRGLKGSKVEGRVLHAATMNAHNTFEQPDVVKPQPFSGAKLAAEGLEFAVPKMSVVALSIR